MLKYCCRSLPVRAERESESLWRLLFPHQLLMSTPQRRCGRRGRSLVPRQSVPQKVSIGLGAFLRFHPARSLLPPSPRPAAGARLPAEYSAQRDGPLPLAVTLSWLSSPCQQKDGRKACRVQLQLGGMLYFDSCRAPSCRAQQARRYDPRTLEGQQEED